MRGVLLVNTGSPQSLTRHDVKAFVGAMLSDPLVLTVPDWFRPILVKGIILPLRQFSSTKHYSLIWDKENDKSPLIYHMEKLAEKLESTIDMPVELGMRYEEPNLADALKRLNEKCEEYSEVVVVPLFPHYAESSYETVVREVKGLYKAGNYTFPLRFIDPYFHHPSYIDALASLIRPYIETDFDKLVFNYHSLPLSHVEKGFEKGVEFDYVYQTKETTLLVCEKLGVEAEKVRQVYSSAMGRNWLKPSLNETVAELAQKGKKNILVVSPGFSVDNLETLFDIGIMAKEEFTKNGGETIRMIPCLNSEDVWVDAIREMIF